MIAPVYLFIEMDSGETHRVMEFQQEGRGDPPPHGTVLVATEDGKPGRWQRLATPENIIDEVARTHPLRDAKGNALPQPVKWTVIQLAQLPASREYRDAWMHDGTTVTHDLAKAKTIALTKIRRAREIALAALDGQWMRAMGKGDTAAGAVAIEAQRQVLRDQPAAFLAATANATTIEEIHAARPDLTS